MKLPEIYDPAPEGHVWLARSLGYGGRYYRGDEQDTVLHVVMEVLPTNEDAHKQEVSLMCVPSDGVEISTFDGTVKVIKHPIASDAFRSFREPGEHRAACHVCDCWTVRLADYDQDELRETVMEDYGYAFADALRRLPSTMRRGLLRDVRADLGELA